MTTYGTTVGLQSCLVAEVLPLVLALLALLLEVLEALQLLLLPPLRVLTLAFLLLLARRARLRTAVMSLIHQKFHFLK